MAGASIRMTLHRLWLLKPRAFSPLMKGTTATAITAPMTNLTPPAIVTIAYHRDLTALLVAHLILVAPEDQADLEDLAAPVDLVVIPLTVAMMMPTS